MAQPQRRRAAKAAASSEADETVDEDGNGELGACDVSDASLLLLAGSQSVSTAASLLLVPEEVEEIES